MIIDFNWEDIFNISLIKKNTSILMIILYDSERGRKTNQRKCNKRKLETETIGSKFFMNY